VRRFIAPIVAMPLLIGGLPASAQNSLSADQIINSLKPTGNAVSGSTRGIRLAAPPSGVTAAPITQAATGQPLAAARPAAAPATAPTAAAPSANLTVNFASGSTDLTPQAIRQLDELGRALSSAQLADYKFRIEGHTDTVGTPESNRALSERRAQAVVAYISSKYGIAATRLEAVGMGEGNLAVPTGAQVAEPRNRRVQIINLGA
jgi:outer membrane protein OmpA-like peptidoglycan-associated protein